MTKRYIVTGASSGIGAATALHLDALGAEVIAGAPGGDHAADPLVAASPRLQRIDLDVTDAESVAAALTTARERFGAAGLDGIVNNAGIGVPGPLEVLEIDAIREQFEVNVLGQIRMTQAALPLLREGTPGRIVFVGSVGGRVASQFAGPYHATKFAMEALADTWRQELDPEALSVILIEPSVISTAIWTKAATSIDALLATSDPRLSGYRERLEGFRDSLQSADEKGADPHDVAETIERALTEARPDSRYTVGAGSGLAAKLGPILPDRLLDKLGERTG